VFCRKRQFDRIVSVEMFEHIMSWRELMTRGRPWLAADGRFFLHIFTHRSAPASYALKGCCVDHYSQNTSKICNRTGSRSSERVKILLAQCHSPV